MKKRPPESETLVGDVHDLRVFGLAVDLESLTKTARFMGESKATVSRRIARLESALGVALLRRTARGVQATDEGRTYRARIAEILDLLGDANAAVRRPDAHPSGTLRVTSPPGLEGMLAPLFAQFARENPEVVVTAIVTERFVDLEGEHVDVALRATSRLADSALVAHRLIDFEQITVAGPQYLAERPAPKHVRDLETHRIIHLGQGRAASIMVMKRADGAGGPIEVSLSTSMAVTDVGFARELAVAGAGVAFLPRVVVRRELREGSLVHLLVSYVMQGSTLFLLHRGGRFLPPKVRAFRDFMMRECAKRSLRARGTPAKTP